MIVGPMMVLACQTAEVSAMALGRSLRSISCGRMAARVG